MTLERFFHEHPRVALAFSGGTDSAYLLYEAVRYTPHVQPYFVQTPFQPEFELRDAHRLAAQLQVPLRVLPHDILQYADVRKNDPQRCYYCKTRLFSLLQAEAQADGFSVLIDGTNASDDAGDRPGMRALSELRVHSPLRLCGITKAEVIARSKAAGLFTGKKAAYACLATRIPTNTPITAEALQRVELGENMLYDLGLRDFRLRITEKGAKLQLRACDFEKACALRDILLEKLDFPELTLDLRAR